MAKKVQEYLNLSYKVTGKGEDRKLVIEIPVGESHLKKVARLSSKGTSYLLASTHGNLDLSDIVPGCPIKLGVNMFVDKQKWEQVLEFEKQKEEAKKAIQELAAQEVANDRVAQLEAQVANLTSMMSQFLQAFQQQQKA